MVLSADELLAIKSLAVDSGVVSSQVNAGGNALNDHTKNWAVDVHVNRLVKIVKDVGTRQLAVIQGNSSNSLVIRGTWPQAISAGTEYIILDADYMQMLRDVFGGGANINAGNPLQVFDPKVWGSVSGLALQGTVTAIPGANQFTIPTLAGLGVGKFADATAPYRASVKRDAGSASAAPQGQMQSITAYNDGTGTFTAPGFVPAIAVGDEILILHPRLAEVLDIKVVTDALQNLTRAGGTVTATGLGTEDNIYYNNAPTEIYFGITVLIDLTSMVGGDQATIREYYRIRAGGNYILRDSAVYNGAQTPDLIKLDLEPNRFGIQVTIDATVGRTFDWEVYTVE